MRGQKSWTDRISSFLREQGLKNENCLELLRGGKNNRVYRLSGAKFVYILKDYFQHCDDTRPRCRTEFSFSTFMWNGGIKCIPQPIACDLNQGLALYSEVRGNAVSPDKVDEPALNQAIDFYLNINSRRFSPEADALAAASEGCFSIAQHVECVEQRVERLCSRARQPGCDSKLREFILIRLQPAWTKIRERLIQTCRQQRLLLEAQLPPAFRRLSPSDFGFHNAVQLPSGELYFLDFEYAGWDDPAKLVCDFFLQPQVPVPNTYLNAFVGVVSDYSREDATLVQRIKVLLDVYRIKWCCILLNEFLPAGEARRQFSAGDEECSESGMDGQVNETGLSASNNSAENDSCSERKAQQIEKSIAYLEELEGRTDDIILAVN